METMASEGLSAQWNPGQEKKSFLLESTISVIQNDNHVKGLIALPSLLLFLKLHKYRHNISKLLLFLFNTV